jgi:DNA repair protein RadD
LPNDHPARLSRGSNCAFFNFYSEDRAIINGVPEKKNALICLPTGAGKSIVIGEIIRRMFQMVPTSRVFMGTHVHTLLSQNCAELQGLWPLAPVGLYSAGLGQAECVQPIIFGGIQSAVNKPHLFGYRDFLFIDEAHLLNDDGSYIKFILALMAANPFLKVVGFTATRYRQGLGMPYQRKDI